MSDFSTLDEWQAYMKALGPKGNGEAAPPDIKFALQAAVLAENLTGDKHWDYYLQCLQGHIELHRKAESDLMDRLAHPMTVDHNTIIALKLALAGVLSTIEALEWAIHLPRSIKDTGEAAKTLEVPDLTSS